MPNSQFAAVAAILAAAIAPLTAQETKSSTRLTTEHYFELERISNAQISPDGARIVYTRQQVNKLEDKFDSSLWIMNADGSQHRFLAKGSNPRWSSDGKRILYLADGEPRGTQIFVRWIDIDGPSTQVTRATEKVADAHWSPDGKSIAYSMFVPQKNKWTISMPSEPTGAKWTAAPRIVESLHYRQDQIGFLDEGYTHLFVVHADGGTPRQLTDGKWSAGCGRVARRRGHGLDSGQQIHRFRSGPQRRFRPEISDLATADRGCGDGGHPRAGFEIGSVGASGCFARRTHGSVSPDTPRRATPTPFRTYI